MVNQTPILIVGAGPTGLMMACELARYGVPYRIIDKKSEMTKTTNAAGVHPRTLEIFEHLGIIDQFLANSIKSPKFEIHSENETLASMSFDVIDSHFNYLIMIPQSETEKILNNYLLTLNGHVERSAELIDLKRENNKLISTIRHADQKIETIESDWVIGCDGYHSMVREKSHIPMTGKDINHEFLVADMLIDTNISHDTVVVFLLKGSILGLFPLAGENKYRIVTSTNQSNSQSKLTEDEMKNIIFKQSGHECSVKEILWSSPFWIHGKTAKTLRQGHVFLAGDAAHVHSPAGAQGMNTGLQDAYNLAWKLALVINHKADQRILDSYEAERFPIIKSIVSVTNKLAPAGLTQNSMILALRNWFIKNIVGRFKKLRTTMAGYIAQIAWGYHKSPIVIKDTKGRYSSSPKPGDRIPDILLKNKTRLYDYLHNNQHNLLLFSGPSPTPETLKNIDATYAWAVKHAGNLIKPYVVTNGKSELPNVIDDIDLTIHKRYGVDKLGMCLIRPDHYIALITADLDPALLQNYFKLLGIPV